MTESLDTVPLSSLMEVYECVETLVGKVRGIERDLEGLKGLLETLIPEEALSTLHTIHLEETDLKKRVSPPGGVKTAGPNKVGLQAFSAQFPGDKSSQSPTKRARLMSSDCSVEKTEPTTEKIDVQD